MVANHGIGGNEVKPDANEAVIEIPRNRTLLAQKLSAETPLRPELVEGLKNEQEVFDHFKPEVKMNFQDAEGATRVETLKFNNLGDFGSKGITTQSKFLSDMDTEKDQYKKIIKQLKTNKILKAALEDTEAKKALINTIDSLINEIGESK